MKKIAATYNISYIEISDALELKEKLSSAIQQTWPIIINTNLIENEVLTPKVAAIPQSDGSMLSMPLEDMSPLLSLETLQNEMIIELSESSVLARKKINELK